MAGAAASVTRRAAVLGSPVAHSLSPTLHRAAYREIGLVGWSYDAIECDEQRLPALLGSLGPEWAGLSLTMPLKRAVLPLLDYTEPLAAEVGGANTVVFADGQRRGFNTDVGAIVTALSEAAVTPEGNVVVLGNGATACSALAALRQMGTTDIAVAVRTPERAKPLLAVADRLGVRVRLIALGPDLASQRWQLLVSTIPAAATQPIAAQLSSGELLAAAILDVGYDPWPTALAAAAAKAGTSVISGYEMLVHQAAGQVELMTGLQAPVSVMHAAGLAELARRRGISDGAAMLR